MTDPSETRTTIDAARAMITVGLMHQSQMLLTVRTAYWSAGNERAALAVDAARNCIARALHDLQRCVDEAPRGPHIAALPEWLRMQGRTRSDADPAEAEWCSMLNAAANEIDRLRADLVAANSKCDGFSAALAECGRGR